MAENYCGKNCNECTYKEQLNCSGCTYGPGNPWTGDCKLAKCCRDKGHENCTTCGHGASCGLLRNKHSIPKERLDDIAYEDAKIERIAKMAPKLKKWLPILFWTAIVSVIAGIFTNDSMSELLPTMYNIGMVAELSCGLIYGVILLIISTESNWYKKAGILSIVVPIVSLLSTFQIISTESPTFLLLTVACVVVVIDLYGEYTEFKDHAEVLADVDAELSAKWDQLWKWNLIVYGTWIGSILLLVLIQVLGVLLSLASAIGALVIGILKLVYLYRTSETFKSLHIKTKQ